MPSYWLTLAYFDSDIKRRSRNSSRRIIWQTQIHQPPPPPLPLPCIMECCGPSVRDALPSSVALRIFTLFPSFPRWIIFLPSFPSQPNVLYWNAWRVDAVFLLVFVLNWMDWAQFWARLCATELVESTSAWRRRFQPWTLQLLWVLNVQMRCWREEEQKF